MTEQIVIITQEVATVLFFVFILIGVNNLRRSVQNLVNVANNMDIIMAAQNKQMALIIRRIENLEEISTEKP